MKLVVFLPNWIGDVVMATPALRAVRERFPTSEIVGVMRPYVADVLAGTGLIDRSMFYNPRGRNPDHRGATFVRSLRAERFDVALLFPNSLRTGVLAWLSGAKRRVGFSRDLRGWFLTDRVVPKARNVPNPVLDEYLRLAQQLGCDIRNRRMQLETLPVDEQRLEQFWRENPVCHEEPAAQSKPSFVCLNTGGAFGAAKNWPRESFVSLAQKIATTYQKRVLVVCGPSEKDDARWIAAEAKHPLVFSLADAPLSIGLSKAAIRAADLLVTTDSGPRHFAAAFGTPVITLFGPTHIAWSEAPFDRGEHLQLQLDCGPCQQRECPLKHHRCMRDLSVEQVFAAVQRQLHSAESKRHVA